MWDSLRGYQEEALMTVQANMPDIQEVVKDKVEGYFIANNLTHVVDDAKELLTLVLGAKPCTKAKKTELVTHLAAARLSAHSLQQNHDGHSELVRDHDSEQTYVLVEFHRWRNNRKPEDAQDFSEVH